MTNIETSTNKQTNKFDIVNFVVNVNVVTFAPVTRLLNENIVVRFVLIARYLLIN